jgi:hypothetical protein
VSIEVAFLIVAGWLVVSITLAFFQFWKSWLIFKVLSVGGHIALAGSDLSVFALITLGFYMFALSCIIGAIIWLSYWFGRMQDKKKALK